MLDERKKQILKAVTDDYIGTAEPVGSRTIARKYKLGVSPATIRNEMADLEEEGYLQQPHTSAGRIPSDKGYRTYVENLMEVELLPPALMRQIEQELRSVAEEMEGLVHRASRILAGLTQYTSVALTPRLGEAVFQHLQLIPLEQEVLIVGVARPGIVQNRLVQMPVPVSPSLLAQISLILNQRLYGLTAHQIGPGVIQGIRELAGPELGEAILGLLQRLLSGESEERVYMEGSINILNQPEFRDMEKARILLELLDQREALLGLLDDGRSGVQVSIGRENRRHEVHECSLVTATYTRGGRTVGTIGVIGPTRMEYARVFSVLRSVSELLSQYLEEIPGE